MQSDTEAKERPVTCNAGVIIREPGLVDEEQDHPQQYSEGSYEHACNDKSVLRMFTVERLQLQWSGLRSSTQTYREVEHKQRIYMWRVRERKELQCLPDRG